MPFSHGSHHFKAVALASAIQMREEQVESLLLYLFKGFSNRGYNTVGGIPRRGLWLRLACSIMLRPYSSQIAVEWKRAQ
jgi:hypothetical protein